MKVLYLLEGIEFDSPLFAWDYIYIKPMLLAISTEVVQAGIFNACQIGLYQNALEKSV